MRTVTGVFCLVLLALPVPAWAQTVEKPESQLERFQLKLFGSARLRYEGVQDAARPLRGDALTLRLRSALEAQVLPGAVVLVEGEAIASLLDRFDDGDGRASSFPVVVDPEGIGLNRAQLSLQLAEGARATLGRQNLNLDDERFIGTVEFRQNAQTFDAVRLTAAPGKAVLIDLAYVGRVNRVLGADNPSGAFEGNSLLVNVNTPAPLGRLAVFHYALDLESGPVGARSAAFSSQTSGVRLTGEKHWPKAALQWAASFAVQRDFAGSPVNYRAQYWLAAASVELARATLSVRAESLGAGGAQAFQTPLATGHAFQGDADVFLITPPQGVVDYSAALEWRFGSFGRVRGLTAFLRAHRFNAETNGVRLGGEIDLGLKFGLGRSSVGLDYAAYEADAFAQDVRRLFFTVSRTF